MRSAAVTGFPVRKQSRHGPWSFWIWNSSSSPAASLEAAATRSSPRGSASTTPAADVARSRTLRSVSMCRKSITSKSATIVSARSTKVSDSSSASIVVTSHRWQRQLRAAGSPGAAGDTSWLATWRRVAIQPQAPGDDIAGHVTQTLVLCISVSPEPGKGLSERDAELHREHARGLVDLGAVQRQIRGLPVKYRPAGYQCLAVRAEMKSVDQEHSRRVREDEAVTEIRVRQRARGAAVQAHDPGTDSPDRQRKREDGPGAE